MKNEGDFLCNVPELKGVNVCEKKHIRENFQKF